MINNIEKKLKLLPKKSGVYQMIDKKGKIIYVGKSINLYNRINQYFNAKKNLKTEVLVKKIKDINVIVTKNEVEALILESNIIKKIKPKYNIILKDDKHYPYIRISLNNDYPKIEIARKRKKDNYLYFGPYISSSKLNEVINIIETVFKVRTCSNLEIKKRIRPCLNYQIKKCLGPCMKYISKKEYKKIIDKVILFLEGKNLFLLKNLKENMKKEAKNLNFEKAILLRNQIKAIKKILEKQKMDNNDFENKDIIGFYVNNKIASICLLFVRDGKMIGKENFFLNFKKKEQINNLIIAFLKQYYSKYFVPKEIIVSHNINIREKNELENLFYKKEKRKIHIRTYIKGKNKDLIDLSNKNAKEYYYQNKIKATKKLKNNIKILDELKKILKLNKKPNRIECFDISHIQGTNIVGSMVVFIKGEKSTGFYRKFKIKIQNKIDDVKSIKEIIERRFKAYMNKKKEFEFLPDLIIIDGGKGQLSGSFEILKNLKLERIPIFALAKREELLFSIYNKNPIKLNKNSNSFYLIQKIRDEAHRFAIKFHKQKRNKQMTASILDEIKGIGEIRKKKLLNYFNSIEKIKHADVQKIAKIIYSKKIAERIKKKLNE